MGIFESLSLQTATDLSLAPPSSGSASLPDSTAIGDMPKPLQHDRYQESSEHLLRKLEQWSHRKISLQHVYSLARSSAHDELKMAKERAASAAMQDYIHEMATRGIETPYAAPPAPVAAAPPAVAAVLPANTTTPPTAEAVVGNASAVRGSTIPTLEPTMVPTLTPSETPTERPSEVPTATPTITPSVPQPVVLTAAPIDSPSAMPSGTPTEKPSSAFPTVDPSWVPSLTPTDTPSAVPTLMPTAILAQLPQPVQMAHGAAKQQGLPHGAAAAAADAAKLVAGAGITNPAVEASAAARAAAEAYADAKLADAKTAERG